MELLEFFEKDLIEILRIILRIPKYVLKFAPAWQSVWRFISFNFNFEMTYHMY